MQVESPYELYDGDSGQWRPLDQPTLLALLQAAKAEHRLNFIELGARCSVGAKLVRKRGTR